MSIDPVKEEQSSIRCHTRDSRETVSRKTSSVFWQKKWYEFMDLLAQVSSLTMSKTNTEVTKNGCR